MQTAFRRIVPFALAALLCSCGAGDHDDPVKKGSADESVVTEYVDPAAPKDGGIDIEVDTAGVIMDYFSEIAFGSEYGVSSQRLCRWEKEIRYFISGAPTDADLELIAEVVARLNTIEGFPGMRETDTPEDANYEIMFITRDEIMEEFVHADETCKGMSEFHWYTKSCEIFKARAAIDCNAAEERESTICEEILQGLGIAQDSFAHRDSVFYQGTCVYTHPSELDYTIIRLVYLPALSPGMSRYECLPIVSTVLKW